MPGEEHNSGEEQNSGESASVQAWGAERPPVPEGPQPAAARQDPERPFQAAREEDALAACPAGSARPSRAALAAPRPARPGERPRR